MPGLSRRLIAVSDNFRRANFASRCHNEMAAKVSAARPVVITVEINHTVHFGNIKWLVTIWTAKTAERRTPLRQSEIPFCRACASTGRARVVPRTNERFPLRHYIDVKLTRSRDRR